ncbi:MAG: hypothetical protein ACXVB9_05200 [Bdellovibrionota bacterium]
MKTAFLAVLALLSAPRAFALDLDALPDGSQLVIAKDITLKFNGSTGAELLFLEGRDGARSMCSLTADQTTQNIILHKTGTPSKWKSTMATRGTTGSGDSTQLADYFVTFADGAGHTLSIDCGEDVYSMEEANQGLRKFGISIVPAKNNPNW